MTAVATNVKGAVFASSDTGKVRFGMITDVHEDLQKDATLRMRAFVKKANEQNVDFIIQLGDLCHSEGVDKILPEFNAFKGKKYHVFGNHDMDHASKEEMLKKYDMPNGYYYFDRGGVRFIVLDCAYTRKNGTLIDYNQGNYFVDRNDRDLIHPEEIVWAERVITESDYPCVLFSHQAFDEIGGSVPNREVFREMLRRVNKPKRKVIAMICGHHHIDAHSQIDGVDYIQVNSASYQWIENGHTYSNGCMAEYQDALYAFVDIDVAKREMRITGRKSVYKEPAPKMSDFSEKYQEANKHTTAWKYIYPVISDRVIRW